MKINLLKAKGFSVGVGLMGLYAAGVLPASAQTWNQTAAGTTYDWTTAGNWTGSVPNAAGATANVNSDLTGAQTIRLRTDTTVGILNLGDSAAATSNFTIGNASPETFNLIFDSGTSSPAKLNLSSAGAPTNFITSGVSLASDLVIDMAGTSVGNSQNLSFTGASGVINLGSKNVTIKNGFTGSAVTFAPLTGAGVIINNSNSKLIFTGVQTNYTGKVVVNGQGGLSIDPNGSLLNTSEIQLNGSITSGAVQNGGSLAFGTGSSQSTNPGQRLTKNTITFNGGTLTDSGQAMAASPTGGRLLSDTVANVKFNSGYSSLIVNANASSDGTDLNITTLSRTAGATAYIKANRPGNTASHVYVGNASGFLSGAGGAAGTTTMSIIPWVGAFSQASAGNDPDGFSTYTATEGVRALVTAEYASSITSGSTNNVKTAGGSGFTLASNTTVNSLINGTSANVNTNMGVGRTLTITSGALMFTNSGTTLGAAGNIAAGTVNFGSEAVVWSLGSNTNTIGAVVAGSNGFIKTGTGTLLVTGVNTYTGATYVNAGTLQVGDGGVNVSNLGITGDVTVANGAILSLMNNGTINDNATLSLQNFGSFNGMVNLASGINETIGALYLGDTLYGAGTYGAIGSGASFMDNRWFSGSGILTVSAIPEPSTYLMFLSGLGFLILLRRRLRKA